MLSERTQLVNMLSLVTWAKDDPVTLFTGSVRPDGLEDVEQMRQNPNGSPDEHPNQNRRQIERPITTELAF